IRVTIKNFGNVAGTDVALKAMGMHPDMFFLSDSVYIGSLSAGGERECTFRAATTTRPTQTYEHGLYSIAIYEGGRVSERDSSYIPIKSGRPELVGVRSSFSKDSIYFSVDIANSGLYRLSNLMLTVSTADGSTMLFDSTCLIQTLQAGSNSGHTHNFVARVLFPVSEPRFRLRLDDNVGPWDTFYLRLRPGPSIDSGFASPTPKGVSICWTKAQRAMGYKVFRGTGIAYPGILPGRTFSDEPLSYQQIYSYTVVAVDSALNEGPAIGPFVQRPNPPHGPHPPVNAPMAFRVGPIICNMDPSYPGMEAVFNSSFYKPAWMSGGDLAELYVVHADGTQPHGFPLLMRMYNGHVLPAVGDIDGDGLLEYVAGDIWNDSLFAFNSDGSIVPGWPVYIGDTSDPTYGGAHVPTPVFMQDFDGDGFPEPGLWSTYGTLWIIDGNGTVLLRKEIGGGWQRNLPATGDLDFDDTPEIAVITANSKLYVLRPDGSVLPGFPVTVDSLASDAGGVAIAEVVKSSPNQEIVTLTSRGTLSVVLYDGTIYSQVNPYYGGQECVSQGPVIADFDNDDTLEIAYIGNKAVPRGYGLADTTLRDTCYIISPQGQIISPPLLKQRGRTDGGLYATAGDIDGDGAAELIVPGWYGTIYAFNIDGSMVPGFPIVIQNDAQGSLDLPSLYSGVTIADQNEDGFSDLHAVTFQGVYHAWETFVPYKKKGWPSWAHDRWNTRCYTFWPNDGPAGTDEIAVPGPRFFLGPPLPNPSRGKVRFQFGIPEPTEVTLALYDVAGRRTDLLLSGKMDPGVYQLYRELNRPSGVYFLRLVAGSRTAVKKMVIAR
ncbi:MAG: T9SS type A sorting domain-containing protein, partial [Candidatus Hydrothermia bacterium]